MKLSYRLATFRDILLNKNKCQESEDKMEHHDTIPLTSPAEVKAFVDNTMLEKLGRGIVGESSISFKMILSFDDEPNKLEALHSSFLLNHFGEIRRWNRWETNTTRKAWVEIIGIPPHAWNVDNVERIVAVCGQVLEVDKRATNSGNFESVLGNMESKGQAHEAQCKSDLEKDKDFLRKHGSDADDFNEPQVHQNGEPITQHESSRSSESTKCILDDRDRELVIKETQLGLKICIKVNPNDLNEVDIDDSISGPTCPPGFEVFLRKDTNQLLQCKIKDTLGLNKK
ncbi:hypothetical protein PIB30_016850 [Stylosanthes scabra]|uniref:DUF4283 domain-containing protein n=1 Tax=Stylosanthes scabra TaxID=79078 RepID=A0ABU6T9H5_9FABA|nr:hypothetical protein [Stylosanthes scabra]